MNQEKSNRELLKPIQLAEELLGGALEHIQNVNDGIIIGGGQQMGDTVKNALKVLYDVRSSILSDEVYSNGAAKAMDHIRSVLDMMQSGNTEDNEVILLTEKLARALAVLYPVSRIVKKPSNVPKCPANTREKSPEVERRAAPRIGIEADIGFQSETNFFVGFTENVSTGGLFIATYDTREIGSKLNVNFTLPDGYLVSVQGIVRWVREYNETTPDTMPGMGVQFENLTGEDQKAIHRFIAERPPIFYE
ncbi:MAG: TIGR02266 family protein [Proteobacteria bacterium]|nr:TIGR02266 family protein [Pseudomonadota bacterium]